MQDEIDEYKNVKETEKVAFMGERKTQFEQHGIAKQGIGYQGQAQQTQQQRCAPLTNLLFSEDMRISRILRRLISENQAAAALELCEKLEVAVRSASNAAYICRSFDMLLDNLTQILKQCPIEAVQQVSNILGLLGYINRTNFPVYKNYITKTYQNCKSLRKYLMLALKTTFRCDAHNLDLNIYSEGMLEVLINYLENAEKAEVFIAISDTISEFSKHYEIAFAEHFTDIVDIVVGWHLETDQPQSLKLHCALVLQRWAAYFLNELDFTYGLLGQFIEDISAWLDDLTAEDANKKTKEKAELRIAAFVGAFTTILKSLSTPTEFIGLTADFNFIENAAITIMKGAKETFTLNYVVEELSLSVNDFLSLLLTYNFKFNDITVFDELLKLQVNHIENFNEQQIGSLLYLIICYLRHQRTALSCNILTFLLNPENEKFANLKLTKNEKNYRLYLKIYHEILLVKNVPLLQEAYKHIKADIHSSIEFIMKQAKENDTQKAVQKLNFYLSALAILATQTSSIISMYALDPSILELLIQNCKAANLSLWTTEPCLYNALIRLLALHCQKNNNFITTSRLLHDQQYTSQVLEEQIRNSPTSEHFTQILQFFAAAFIQIEKHTLDNLKLLIKWLEQLIDICKPQISILCSNNYFLSIYKSLSTAAALFAPLESAKCMQATVISHLPNEILFCIKATAIYLMNSPVKNIQAAYADIFATLPLSISLAPLDLKSDASKQLKNVIELKKWYQGTHHYAPMRAKYFKEFLNYLDFPFLIDNTMEKAKNHKTLENIFFKCFIDQSAQENVAQYQATARQQSALISSWIQNEAARYCVRNKLRTTIGKPQDTFLGIEAIVMKYARKLSAKELTDKQCGNELNNLAAAADFQHRAHLLLGFLEALEKHIYNAAQGTAFAMPAAEKPAKTFFRINASTCNEWFKRIRPSVCLIAIHCMKPEIAIRYSERTLSKANQLNSTLLEHTMINMVETLLTCKEADSLTGLYVWIRTKMGKNFTWIQCAADQAGGHLESAVSRYKALLDENHMRLDDHIKQFIVNQLLYCLYFTGQWKELQELLKKYGDESNQDAFQLFYNARSYAHLDTMQALCYGSPNNETNLKISNALMQLMDWSSVHDYSSDLKSTTALTNFSSHRIFQTIEDSFIVQTLKVQQQHEPKRNLPKGIISALDACLQECVCAGCAFTSNSWNADFTLLNQVTKMNALNETDRCENIKDLTKLLNENLTDTTLLTKCVLWSLLSEQRAVASGGFGENCIREREIAKQRLYLDLAMNARQDGNLNYCRKVLEQFFIFKNYDKPLADITQNLLINQQNMDINDIELLHGISELSKCLYMTGQNQTNSTQQYQNEAINLSSVLCLQILERTQEKKSEQMLYAKVAAKTLHTLGDWLGQRNLSTSGGGVTNIVTSLENLTQLQQLLDKLNEPLLEFNDKKLNESIPVIDKAIGKLYNASTLQKTDVADTWLAYGNWCYRWGKKLLELKVHFHALSNKNSENELSERDLNELGTILKQNFSQELLSDISQVLQRHQFNSKIDAADDDLESNFTGSALELIEVELRQIDALKDLSSNDIMDIIRIWRRTHKTVYAYYESAIKAYLKYLTLETSSANNKTNDDCGFVTTTLRILRLVVKHAFALQEVLEAGLNTTPLRPWKVIIPQLFSRLNHHEPYVRNSLAQLLCRLAQDEPHAVIFPAVVGSQQEILQSDAKIYSEQNSTDISTTATTTTNRSRSNVATTTTTTTLTNCFGDLVAKLSEQSPQTVRHVQLLVRELRRVALLGEEYWLHALGRLLTEYSTLFSTLVLEIRKCNRTNTLQMEKYKAKHEILLQYVIADLQKIALHTAKPAETNYERNFKTHYETQIEQTLIKLNESAIIEAGPVESWQLLKNLYQRFQQRSLHGLSTAASTLKISDVSLTLANMRDTGISMPGVSYKQGAPIYIKAIEHTIHILPTKTRPKKLVFLGSDGQKYTYLFKGLEDLHLDERIMQFLSISNLMMQRSRDRRHQTQVFRAHHYSVIPLGPQSGLISWVDGVTPLFAIYKKWQQRDAALKQQQSKERSNVEEQQQNSACSQLTALRPSELFYKKLRPLLTAHNIKLKDSRKQWPLSVLRRVLDELTDETPHDLLSKELWTTATSAAEWHSNVRNYAISTAVMSVIGYIIGLGDRHLDNVLINLCTGEIVHIDYNVCFEKGKTLRVPEKVPFRMTPNFENALGATGVEGTFRLGCEYVLKTLRKEKETLLTLLEAFVYDPLVDWTVSDDGVGGGTTRSALAYTAMQSVTSVKPASSANITANAIARESPIRVTKQYEIMQRKKEWEIMQQTIKNRFEDIRSHWSEYIDEIEQNLQKIYTEKKALEMNLEKMNQIEDERNKLNQQVAMIRELEMLGTAIGSHSLNTLTQRFQTYKQDVEAILALRKSAEIAQNDIETLLSSYFKNVTGDVSDLVSMQNELLQQENNANNANEFEAMRYYIEQISTKLYEDVNFARQEMNNSLQQQSRASLECIKLLMQYARIMNFYPRSRLRIRNGLFRYSDWYRQLWLEDTNLNKLKAEVEACHKCDNEVEIYAEVDKMRVIQYAGLMEKTLYELNMSSHQLLAVKEHMREQQQLSDAEDIVQEIKDFADLDKNTRTTLQAAMLQLLTEALTQLDAGDGSQNLLKEINYIQNISLIFKDLKLKPKTVQQNSEEKMLKSLESTLKALNDLEQDFGFEFVVQLFFIDDDLELQNQLAQLCSGELNNLENIKINEKLRLLLKYLGNKFDAIESELLQLQLTVQEILDVETCSWYNILLERLCVVRSLKNADLIKWRNQTIGELFSLARDNVESLRLHRIKMIYDARLLFSSIGVNVRSLYNSYLKGLTLALSEAYINSFQMNLNYAESNAAARLLGSKLISVLQHNFEMAQLHLQIVQNKKISENFTYVASAYVWINHALLNDMLPNLSHVILKETLLSVISSVNQSLSAWKHTIVKIQDDLTQHIDLLQKRLRWIVTGNMDSDEAANEIISKFKHENATQTSRFSFFLQLAVKLVENVNILLQFETLMNDSNTGLNTRRKAEASFLVLIDEWQQVRSRHAQSNATITPVEKCIVELLDPEDKVDACWIANISGLLEELSFGVQKNLSSLEETARVIEQRLYQYGSELQILTENPLRTDMRQLLRLIIKNAKYPTKGAGSSPSLADDNYVTISARELLQLLKTLFGKLGELKTKLYLRNDYDKYAIKQLEEKLEDVKNALNQQRKEVNTLIQNYLEQSNYSSRSNSASPARVASPAADRKDETIEKKGEQKRNAYAVSVWKRIRMKLEGRDPDTNRRSSVTEQVDFIINEAMNRDNLAMLYEGWTPWV